MELGGWQGGKITAGVGGREKTDHNTLYKFVQLIKKRECSIGGNWCTDQSNEVCIYV